MFTGVQWNFDKRFAQFPNLASPETSTIDKILTLNHPSTCVYGNYSSIMTQDLLHLTILNNLHSCQHWHKNGKNCRYCLLKRQTRLFTKTILFWDVMLCHWVSSSWCFTGYSMYFHLHSPALVLLDTGDDSTTIFETYGITHPTACHIPEHLIFSSIAVANSRLTIWGIRSVFNDGANHLRVHRYSHGLITHTGPASAWEEPWELIMIVGILPKIWPRPVRIVGVLPEIWCRPFRTAGVLPEIWPRPSPNKCQKFPAITVLL